MNTTDNPDTTATWTRTLGGFSVSITGGSITHTDHDGITADRARILGTLLLQAAEKLDLAGSPR